MFIVATPIGNLEDITLRAIRVLKEADIVAAEDTRRARILLSHYGVGSPLTSFFSAAQARKAPALIEKLLDGQNVALITEAGTPGISDPGHYLVSLARREGVKIVPIPGPAALTAAISASGMRSYAFTFYGFLPHKGGKRNRALKSLALLEHPFVLYESPHRLRRTLADLLRVLGNRKLFIAREMTKIFEEFIETTVQEAIGTFESKEPRGEFTLIVGEKVEQSADLKEVEENLCNKQKGPCGPRWLSPSTSG